MNCFTKSLKIFSISLLPLVSFGQIINKGLYQVYERQDIVNTALRLNNDSTYTVQATVINCSLYDHDTLYQIVYQKGTWTIVNDTLVLFDKVNETNNKLIIENPETLKPLYLIGLMIDKSKIKQDLVNTSYQRLIDYGQKYYLTTETYSTGEVKRIIPRDYDGKWTGLEINFDKAGRVWDINRYKKGKYINEVR